MPLEVTRTLFEKNYINKRHILKLKPAVLNLQSLYSTICIVALSKYLVGSN